MYIVINIKLLRSVPLAFIMWRFFGVSSKLDNRPVKTRGIRSSVMQSFCMKEIVTTSLCSNPDTFKSPPLPSTHFQKYNFNHDDGDVTYKGVLSISLYPSGVGI